MCAAPKLSKTRHNNGIGTKKGGGNDSKKEVWLPELDSNLRPSGWLLRTRFPGTSALVAQKTGE